MAALPKFQQTKLRPPLLGHSRVSKKWNCGKETIPEVVRKFIAKHIHSVDVLEILLLLRQEPGKEWGAAAVSEALRLNRASVHSRLQRLLAAELVSSRHAASEEVFKYQPVTSELAHAVDELEKWYSSHCVALVSFIYSNPGGQTRTYPNDPSDK
jgi:hypothetical protein